MNQTTNKNQTLLFIYMFQVSFDLQHSFRCHLFVEETESFVTSNCSHSGFGWLCSHGDLSLIFPVSSWLMSQCPFFLGATYFSSYHVKKNVASARHSFSNALTAHGVQASPLSSIYCNRSTSRHTAFPLTVRALM